MFGGDFENLEESIGVTLISQKENKIRKFSQIEFSQDFLSLEFEFEDAYSISSQQEADYLRLEFLQTFLFLSQESLLNIEKGTVLLIEIPPQIPQDQGKYLFPFNFNIVSAVETLSKVSKSTDISGRTFVMSNFLLNLAFSSSLNMLWTLVNAL